MQRLLTLLGVTLLALGCEDSTGPSNANALPGRYQVSTFVTIHGRDTNDLVKQGIRLNIRFAADSTIKGVVQLAGSDSLPFSGAWAERDSVVALKMSPPTLLEIFRFHHREDRLEVDTLLETVHYQLILTRH